MPPPATVTVTVEEPPGQTAPPPLTVPVKEGQATVSV